MRFPRPPVLPPSPSLGWSGSGSGLPQPPGIFQAKMSVPGWEISSSLPVDRRQTGSPMRAGGGPGRRILCLGGALAGGLGEPLAEYTAADSVPLRSAHQKEPLSSYRGGGEFRMGWGPCPWSEVPVIHTTQSASLVPSFCFKFLVLSALSALIQETTLPFRAETSWSPVRTPPSYSP